VSQEIVPLLQFFVQYEIMLKGHFNIITWLYACFRLLPSSQLPLSSSLLFGCSDIGIHPICTLQSECRGIRLMLRGAVVEAIIGERDDGPAMCLWSSTCGASLPSSELR
jgi:hypothetical protein